MNSVIKILSISCIFLLSACQKDDYYADPDTDSPLSLNQQMNLFIEEQMKSIYLWAEEIKEKNPNFEQEPEKFLSSLRYQEDKWSYLEVDNTATRSLTDGKEKTFGYKIQFYKISDKNVCGVILYVYKNSAADKAGLKRGDIILSNNGNLLTEENYSHILTDETCVLQKGYIQNDTLFLSETEYSISQSTIEKEPILLDTIININHKKIGYFVYLNFYDNQSTHLPKLSQSIGKMKDAAIDEFILDLRYNSGGTETAARHFCSLLAPAEHVRNKEILIRKQWNPTYQKKISSNQSITRFNPDVLAQNLNLKKIYILTTEKTASASEVVISCLRPYVPQIIVIGTKTYGKYVGMSKITPTKENLKKWALWPVTCTYTNAEGESVKGGLSPTYTIKEKEFFLSPFGSLSDPLLNKAISLITGTNHVSEHISRTTSAPQKWRPIGEIKVEPLLSIMR